MKLGKRQHSLSKGSRLRRRKLAIVSLILILVVILALGLHDRTDQTSGTTSANQTSSKTVASKGDQANQTAASTPSNSSSSEPPKTPYGSFVSSHSARFNDAEASVCTTSVGAKCQILFSKDGISKILTEKTTDADGAAYWSWMPQDLGLTAGSWQITATASQNGKTASATDARNLVIQP